ncbi:hypothetical protein HOLleu_35534 [Holothuria leucospilota]|uniref:IgGFc-binding protein N-terminal domain-containing protein n=1 Tax=Holothuria leucospilota TaxID=206669 RepID=A0A9Q0YKY2_HOLLE|nr:hypothetical protein HOLleu_35534 [Holothuria leucospilota]
MLRIANCPETDTTIQLFIATEGVGAEGLISFPLQSISDISFNLSRGVGEFFDLTLMALPGNSTGTVRRRETSTVVVAAAAEIVVYGHVRCSHQLEGDPKRGSVRGTAFQMKRVGELGNNYSVVTFQKCGRSQLAIVAVEEKTVVEIQNNDIDVLRNVSVTLQKYETYIIEGMFDMTGTHISSSAPVFVLTGNDGDGIEQNTCSNSSSSNNTDKSVSSCDNGNDPFYECLIPYTHWGTRYFLFPLFDTSLPMVYKVLSPKRMNVTIRERQKDGKYSNSDLRTSKFIKKNIICSQTHSVVEIESPEVMLVAQFSAQKERSISMLLATPSLQFTRKYTVFPVLNIRCVDDAATHYISIILTTGVQTNVLYINNDSTSIWQKVGNFTDGSRVVRTILSPGSNLLENRGL